MTCDLACCLSRALNYRISPLAETLDLTMAQVKCPLVCIQLRLPHRRVVSIATQSDQQTHRAAGPQEASPTLHDRNALSALQSMTDDQPRLDSVDACDPPLACVPGPPCLIVPALECASVGRAAGGRWWKIEAVHDTRGKRTMWLEHLRFTGSHVDSIGTLSG